MDRSNYGRSVGKPLLLAAALVAVAIGAPAAALAASATGSLPGWAQRMMRDAPPPAKQMMQAPAARRMMNSPQMRDMMATPGMQRMMERPAERGPGMMGMMDATGMTMMGPDGP